MRDFLSFCSALAFALATSVSFAWAHPDLVTQPVIIGVAVGIGVFCGLKAIAPRE